MPKAVSNRQLRRTVVQHQQALEEGFAPALRVVIENEAKTRGRVDVLEGRADEHRGIAKEHAQVLTEHRDILRRGLAGRLLWLLTGK